MSHAQSWKIQVDHRESYWPVKDVCKELDVHYGVSMAQTHDNPPKGITLPTGDVAYVSEGRVFRVDEIKSPGDFLQSIYSGHLREQLTRMRVSTPEDVELGLVVFVDPEWTPSAFKMLSTVMVRQGRDPVRPISVTPIYHMAMLGCYFARTLEMLQQKVSLQPPTAAPQGLLMTELARTAKKKHITDGRALYLYTLQGIRGISKDRAKKILAIAPSLSHLQTLITTKSDKLNALINKPGRHILMSYFN